MTLPTLAVYLEDGRIRDVVDPLDSCQCHPDIGYCGGCGSCLVMQFKPDYWWTVPAEFHLRSARICRTSAGECYAHAFDAINRGRPDIAEQLLRSVRTHLLRMLVHTMLWSKALPVQIEADAELPPEHLGYLRSTFERCPWSREYLHIKVLPRTRAAASLDEVR